MSARALWKAAYRAARLVGHDAYCRERMRRCVPYAHAAIAITDARALDEAGL